LVYFQVAASLREDLPHPPNRLLSRRHGPPTLRDELSSIRFAFLLVAVFTPMHHHRHPLSLSPHFDAFRLADRPMNKVFA